MLSFGDGGCGQLGHGTEEEQRVPKAVAALRGQRVLAVAAGGGHSLVLTQAGAVLSFGWGTTLAGSSCLGHGNEQDQRLPKVIEALRGQRATAVAAGECHSLVLTADGTVYSFGAGECGQLGHGDEEDHLLPTAVEALRGQHVVACSAGDHHSLMLTQAGVVLSCGAGEHGQLGHGDAATQLRPKAVEALRGESVRAVVAAKHHSLCVLQSGRVLGWGFGEDATLGLHLDRHQLTPLAYPSLEKYNVKSAACR